jgi:aldehyde:ferredoxin oxidoreductase
MLYGYHNRVLHVDLTRGTFEVEQPGEDFFRKYMGGSALGAYYLLRHTPAGTDPLAPENTLVIALSVITGAPISGQSRLTVTARSPLTGGIGDSQSGGFFPAELKFAGFDALVIHGRAARPVYLWIHDGQAELRPAEHLWGLFTGDAEAQIKQELGDQRVEVLQCGPAGENGVRFAALMSMSNRASGRTGMGAVMGSKNLRAVAVRGTDRPALADRKRLQELAKWGATHLNESGVKGLNLQGTASVTRSQNISGGLPTRNWQSGTFEQTEAIDGDALAQTIFKERDTCYACAVRCKRVVEVAEGPYRVTPFYGGPEYETIAMFGANCGVGDLKAIAYAHRLCEMYGMDTISCGMTISWAMECFERGLLTPDDTGGLAIRFGDAGTMLRLVEMIGRREGFGALLAEGSARAAARIGRGMEALTLTVKQQELPAHMPQVKRSLGLIYAVNSFGPDHESSQHDTTYTKPTERMAELGLTSPQPADSLNEEKVRFAYTTQVWNSCVDSLDVCQFVFGPAWQLYGPAQLVETVQAVTGWDVTLDELMQVGARRLNLLRAFNAREGIGREADTLPAKLSVPLRGGKTDGVALPEGELERAKDAYYALAGWDAVTGMPTRATLERLDLAWVADMLGL